MPRVSYIIKCTGSERNLSKAKAHCKYVGFRSKELNEKGFFSAYTDTANHSNFIKRLENNPALKHSNTVKVHKLVFALPKDAYAAYKRSGKDFKDIVRQTMSDYEKNHDVKLDWIANIHKGDKSENPHCHVIIKGVSDIKGDRGYKRIKFRKDDFKELRGSYQKAFEKDVKYRFYEKDEFKDMFKDMAKGVTKDGSKSVEQVVKKFANQANRDQEKDYNSRMNKLRKELTNRNIGEEEIIEKQKTNKKINRERGRQR